MRRLLSPIIIALGLSLVTTPSLADTEAESLFQQALEDMRAADFVSACPKLEKSHDLEAKSGTLISLAFCHEKLGRTATAWRNYRDAATLAAQEGRDDYVTKANGLAAQLVPRLANVRVRAPAIEGLTVAIDGEVVAPEDRRGDIHVDPGRNTVVAEAPGRRTWTTTIDVGTEERKTVEVPDLEKILSSAPLAPPAPTITPTPTANDAGPSAGAIAGYTLIGVGGAASIAGLVLGGLVLGKKSTVEEQCDQDTRECTPNGLEARDAGATLSTASTATLIGGLALAGTGVTLVLLTGDDEDPSPLTGATISLRPLPGGGTLEMGGRF